jgi:hypothetical protein
MTALASSHQIQALQAMRRKAGISDDDWRAKLQREAGVTSTKLVPIGVAIRLIDDLKGALNGTSNGLRSQPDGASIRATRGAKGALRLEGPFAGKMRALWISAFALGLVADRTDEALASFVKRQTGLDHPNWLRDPAKARSVIEALKSWITRETGLDWGVRIDPRELKVRIVETAWHRALELGVVYSRVTEGLDLASFGATVVKRPTNTVNDIVRLTDSELDQVALAIGRKIRRKLDGAAA